MQKTKNLEKEAKNIQEKADHLLYVAKKYARNCIATLDDDGNYAIHKNEQKQPVYVNGEGDKMTVTEGLTQEEENRLIEKETIPVKPQQTSQAAVKEEA